MFEGLFRNLQLFEDLVVPLEDLDRIPALLFFRHVVYNCFFDVRKRVFHRAGEGMHRNGFGVLRSIYCGFGCFHDAGPFEGGNGNGLAAESLRQLVEVDLVLILLDDVDHVDRQDHRDAKFGQLCRQVEVPLQVGSVDNVQDGIRTFLDEVVPRHHFFQCVRRKRVDTGKVRDRHVVMLLQLSFFFLDCYARPVSDKLVGAGQCIKQSRFTAVRVSCKCYPDVHHSTSIISASAFRMESS